MMRMDDVVLRLNKTPESARVDESVPDAIEAQNGRIFYRVYIDAINSGLVGDMGSEKWQTLTVLASFMDAKGECYPSQETIANRLGIARETANRRISKLLRYRWRGKAIITSRKNRNPKSQSWENTIYTILPESCIRIFGDRDTQTSHA